MTKHTVEGLKARIHQLSERDSIGNVRIINKLKRKARKLENQE